MHRLSTQTLCISLMLFLFFYSAPTSLAETAAPPKSANSPLQIPPVGLEPLVDPDLESKIVDLYAENKCPAVREIVKDSQFPLLKPVTLAIVAYCQSDTKVAENLFEQAEKRDPSSDVVVALHARYRWFLDPASAEPLWRRVLLLARSPVTSRLAQEYLQGTIENSSNDGFQVGQKFTYFANIQVGGSHEWNPLAVSNSDAVVDTPPRSAALNAQVALGAQYDLGFASQHFNYAMTYNRYISLQTANFMEHDIDLPFAVKAGDREELQLRPYASHLSFGNQPLQILGGVGIVGVLFRPDYKMSIQGSFFGDHYLQEALQQQDGSHFRFDYNWEYYPADWFMRFVFYVEHVSADRDIDTTNSLNIAYSHNDVGLLAFLQYNVHWAIFGIFPKFITRQDDLDSSFIPNNSTNNQVATKRRQDFTVTIQPNITIPLDSGVQLFAWFEWSRTFSNMGSNDYLDRSTQNKTIGLAIRSFISGL